MARSVFGTSIVASAVLAGCLNANQNQDDSSEASSSSETGRADTSVGEASTYGGIMTTTEVPDSDPSDPATTSDDAGTTGTGTTESVPPGCGNGVMDGDEECDNGEANADDAACTTQCNKAFCGDGLVQANKEECDDSVNDGAYGGCQQDCQSLAPYCGDGVVEPIVEECDDKDAESGCLAGACKYATSCLELKTAWGVGAPSGVYPLHPKEGISVDAFCEMGADEGGYTFVKIDGASLQSAVMAEAKCGAIGMRLLVPRSPAHLAAAVAVANEASFKPAGGGMAPMDPYDYLRIFGIYPVASPMTCIGEQFNSEMCPEWQASDGQGFWISDVPIPTQPSASNCALCSMEYLWNNMALAGYEAYTSGGKGAVSTHFMCDVGDKQPMN